MNALSPTGKVRIAISGSEVSTFIPRLELTSGAEMSQEQKLLLCNTGSTEQLLRTIHGSIHFRVLHQRETKDKILRRSEILGDESGTVLIRAEVAILKGSFDRPFLDRIRAKRFGIGSLLLEGGIRHRRRILQAGYDYASRCPFRQYLIVLEGHRPIKILEYLLPKDGGNGKNSVDRVGFEPTTSAMPMPYPTGLDDRP